VAELEFPGFQPGMTANPSFFFFRIGVVFNAFSQRSMRISGVQWAGDKTAS
jgi:hypothetical protein